MHEHDGTNQPVSQATNFAYRFTEDALSEDFARETDGRVMYVPARGQWFLRREGSDGPYWEHDDRLVVWLAIRDYLRRTAAAHPRDFALSARLGSAATVQAVEFLARADLVGEEDDLEPGALAEHDRQLALMLAAIRKSRAAPAAPASPPVAAPNASPAAPRARRRE
jgi:hypothetical protein